MLELRFPSWESCRLGSSVLLELDAVLPLELEVSSELLGPELWSWVSLELLETVSLDVFVGFWLWPWDLGFQLWARIALSRLSLCFGVRAGLFFLGLGPSVACLGPCLPGRWGGSVFLGFGLWVASALLEWRLWP